MNTYIVTMKKSKDEAFWDTKKLIVVASDFGNAQDKAENFYSDRTVVSISLNGASTHKTDVYEITERP